MILNQGKTVRMIRINAVADVFNIVEIIRQMQLIYTNDSIRQAQRIFKEIFLPVTLDTEQARHSFLKPGCITLVGVYANQYGLTSVTAAIFGDSQNSHAGLTVVATIRTILLAQHIEAT